MQRYQVHGKIGDGAFGVVFKGTHTVTGETVAIKRMKQHFNSWEECLQLREIQSLRRLQHANVIKLKEVIRENTELCMVFEFMEQNVYQITRNRVESSNGQQPFNEKEVRSIICQTLLGLQYMHRNGFFHRDLKPENLLTKGDVVKVADFGLAKEIRSRPPFTEYVSTRWYRAPEVILRSTHYNSPIDIWALGVIMAELYSNRPLFPGSSDGDQLFKICSVLGAPTPAEWDEGHQLARRMNMRFPPVSPTPLRQIIPHASPVALDLMEQMLRFNPQERLTSTACLQHPFFTGSGSVDTGNSFSSYGASNTSLFQGISSRQAHNPHHLAAGVPSGNTSTVGLPSGRTSGAPTPVGNPSPTPGTGPGQISSQGGVRPSGTTFPSSQPAHPNPIQSGWGNTNSGAGSGFQHGFGVASNTSQQNDIPTLRSNTPTSTSSMNYAAQGTALPTSHFGANPTGPGSGLGGAQPSAHSGGMGGFSGGFSHGEGFGAPAVSSQVGSSGAQPTNTSAHNFGGRPNQQPTMAPTNNWNPGGGQHGTSFGSGPQPAHGVPQYQQSNRTAGGGFSSYTDDDTNF